MAKTNYPMQPQAVTAPVPGKQAMGGPGMSPRPMNDHDGDEGAKGPMRHVRGKIGKKSLAP